MVSTASVIGREIGSQAFLRDLRSFLGLDEAVLLAISDIGQQPDGFIGLQQAQRLEGRFDIEVDHAMALLRLADHLYRRVDLMGLDVSEAVEQIASIASRIREPVSIDDEKKNAIAKILSPKGDYEVSRAVENALSNGPHFVRMEVEWSTKLAKVRNGDIIKIPIVGLSIIWHDSGGNSHETFLQLSEEEWGEFTSTVADFNEGREELEDFLRQ